MTQAWRMKGRGIGSVLGKGPESGPREPASVFLEEFCWIPQKRGFLSSEVTEVLKRGQLDPK